MSFNVGMILTSVARVPIETLNKGDLIVTQDLAAIHSLNRAACSGRHHIDVSAETLPDPDRGIGSGTKSCR